MRIQSLVVLFLVGFGEASAQDWSFTSEKFNWRFTDSSVEVYTFTDSFVEVKLKKFDDFSLERIVGPSWEGPDGDCLMCLGNHLIGEHYQAYDYLMKLGYSKWQILHDNLHNDPSFKGQVGNDSPTIGYGQGRGRLFRRR